MGKKDIDTIREEETVSLKIHTSLINDYRYNVNRALELCIKRNPDQERNFKALIFENQYMSLQELVEQAIKDAIKKTMADYSNIQHS